MSVDLSIVIPNYNHAHYFPAVIENCFQGNPLRTEVIVIDDGSTDSSLVRLRDAESKSEHLRVVELDENTGVPNALNKGIELAKGKWMVFRAADDLFPEGSLKVFAETINRYPDCGLVTGDVSFFVNELTHQTVEKTGLAKDIKPIAESNYLNDYGGNIIHGTSSFVRREWISEAGGFDDHLKWHSDWYVLMDIGFSRGFIYVPETLGAMRLNPQSYNSAGTLDLPSRNKVLKHLIHRLDRNSKLKQGLLQNGCLDFYGAPLKNAIQQDSNDIESYRPLFETCSQEIIHARENTGIRCAIREFLSEHFEAIQNHDGDFLIFGAGGHSHLVIEVMAALKMRAIDGVVDRVESNEIRFFNGLKIEPVACLTKKRNPLVLLSSKSYEPLFSSTLETETPGIPFLKIWGRS
jgi:glycosyltransferase involved in cell wall biosynthesis